MTPVVSWSPVVEDIRRSTRARELVTNARDDRGEIEMKLLPLHRSAVCADHDSLVFDQCLVI